MVWALLGIACVHVIFYKKNVKFHTFSRPKVNSINGFILKNIVFYINFLNVQYCRTIELYLKKILKFVRFPSLPGHVLLYLKNVAFYINYLKEQTICAGQSDLILKKTLNFIHFPITPGYHVGFFLKNIVFYISILKEQNICAGQSASFFLKKHVNFFYNKSWDPQILSPYSVAPF